MDLIKVAEEAFATGKTIPAFRAGDTITVAYKIVEGSKERIQLYRGVVIKISGHGLKKRFTVRKMSGTVGVERIFAVRCVALSFTICVSSPVRLHASRRSASSLASNPSSVDYNEIKSHSSSRGVALLFLRGIVGASPFMTTSKSVVMVYADKSMTTLPPNFISYAEPSEAHRFQCSGRSCAGHHLPVLHCSDSFV